MNFPNFLLSSIVRARDFSKSVILCPFQVEIERSEREKFPLYISSCCFFLFYIGDTCLAVEKEKVQMFLLVVLTFVCACEAIRLLYFFHRGVACVQFPSLNCILGIS